MTSPIRVPQFADIPAKEFLAGVLGSDAQVRSNLPDKWTPKQTPVLIVADDGGPDLFPVATRRQIRLTAYSDGQTRSRRLVTRAWALLLCSTVPGLANVREGIVPVDAGKDPQHPDALLATGSVIATIRTAAL